MGEHFVHYKNVVPFFLLLASVAHRKMNINALGELNVVILLKTVNDRELAELISPCVRMER